MPIQSLLTPGKIDSVHRQLYYRDGPLWLCYEEVEYGCFQLCQGSADDEPELILQDHDYVSITPLPVGHSPLENRFRAWLVSRTMSNVIQAANDYLRVHGGVPTELDMRINDISRATMRQMQNLYGNCYLVNINLHGDQRGNRASVAVKADAQEGSETFNAYNFSGDYAAPMITDELVDLILQRDKIDTTRMAVSVASINQIQDKLMNLGAIPLLWA